MLRFLPILLFVICFLFPGRLIGEECRLLRDDQARLACYDKLAVSKQEDIGYQGKWNVIRAKDDLTLDEQIIATLIAEEARVFSRSPSLPQKAVLTLTCMRGKPKIIFEFPERSVAYHDATVEYRIGNSPPRKTIWPASADNEAFGPWDKPEARHLVRQMLDADELVIYSSTEIFGAARARFDIRGLRTALKFAKECGSLS